jgi:hypothetical protein
MKAYQKEKMFIVTFHNNQETVPAPVSAFVRDSFNDEVVLRLERYQREMAGNILALIFSGDSVFFHSQPFDGSPAPLKNLLARPFGLKPKGDADFAAFDRFLDQTERFIHGDGDSTDELIACWQHFADFIVSNAAGSRNEWAAAAEYEKHPRRPVPPEA